MVSTAFLNYFLPTLPLNFQACIRLGHPPFFLFTVDCVFWLEKNKREKSIGGHVTWAWFPLVPRNNKTWSQNQHGGRQSWCSYKSSQKKKVKKIVNYNIGVTKRILVWPTIYYDVPAATRRHSFLPSFLFFFWKRQTLGRLDDGKQRKKGDNLTSFFFLSRLVPWARGERT